MHGWTDLEVDLSEPVAAHLVYMNLDFHGHSFIQCDISILLKSIEICKSRVVATLNVVHSSGCLPELYYIAELVVSKIIYHLPM